VEKTILQQVQIRNPKIGLDFRGISAMNIVEDGWIYSRGEDREKANKVIIPDEIHVDGAELSHAEPEVGADKKDEEDGSPTSTQVS